MKYLCYLFIFCWVGLALAENPPEAKPTEQLPAQIPSVEGKASIFVEWPNDRRQPASVYLINRTAQPVELVIAYGQIRLYWEAETKPQQWERAQVQYWDQCGTGIGTYKLPPGQWIQQQVGQLSDQPLSKESFECPVRLRSYNAGFEVSSNSGKAFVDPKIIATANCDVLAVHLASNERLANIVRGKDPACGIGDRRIGSFTSAETRALWELQQRALKDRQKVLSLLQDLSKESQELGEFVAPALKELEKK